MSDKKNMEQLTSVDRAILNRIQSDFPITSQPFKTIAEELGLDEQDVLSRIHQIESAGDHPANPR